MSVQHRVDMWRFYDELMALSAKQLPQKDATLFYGSSTFAIWKQIEEIFASYNAVNFGFGGSTADEALFHYEWLAQKVHPKTLVWYFGDNEPVCGYTEEETFSLFVDTWNKFIADNHNINIIILATKTDPARDEFAAQALRVNALARQYAQEHANFYFVETDDICRNENGYIEEHFLPDRLHFSPKAYGIIAPRIISILEKLA